MQEYIKTNIRESMEAKRQLLEDTSLIESIEQIAALCIAAYQNGNKILVCGNGGSASDDNVCKEVIRKDYPDLSLAQFKRLMFESYLASTIISTCGKSPHLKIIKK